MFPFHQQNIIHFNRFFLARSYFRKWSFSVVSEDFFDENWLILTIQTFIFFGWWRNGNVYICKPSINNDRQVTKKWKMENLKINPSRFVWTRQKKIHHLAFGSKSLLAEIYCFLVEWLLNGKPIFRNELVLVWLIVSFVQSVYQQNNAQRRKPKCCLTKHILID